MINLKSKEEIEEMKVGGKILKETADELVAMIEPGISTLEIDKIAEEKLIKKGAQSSFKRVKGYRWTTCLPINEQAVHTPPSQRKLKDGESLTLDIGAYYKGLHTDYATTFIVGKARNPDTVCFLDVGQKTLEKAIAKIKSGIYIGEVSKFIEDGINNAGYKILKDLTGHGIGRELHEEPYVLNYLDRPVNKTYKLEQGMTLAVEIIYAVSTTQIAYEKDVEWSIISKDHSLSACFERSIAIEKEKTYILT